jgi:hypothetical protein
MKNQLTVLAVGVVGAALLCTLQGKGTQETPSCSAAKAEVFRNEALPVWTGNLTWDVQWRACARVVDPWSPERRICVTRHYDGRASADFAIAQGGKLSDQFCSLRASFPNAKPRDLISHAKLTGPIRIPPSPSLDRLAADFENLKLGLRLPNVMVMDHPIYEIELHTQHGSELRLTLANAPLGDPVVSWVNRALQLAEAANQRSKPAAGAQ